MSKRIRNFTKPHCAPTEEREQYIKDNAVALVTEMEGLILRLHKKIAVLETVRKNLRATLDKERKQTFLGDDI